MSTPTQEQVCARCGSPRDAGDAFCGNCGASISRPVTQLPPSYEYLRREPGTDSTEHTASAYDPQAQAPRTSSSDPPPFNPPPLSPQQPDWTDTVRSFVRRMPIWARLVALGVTGLVILILASAAHSSGGGSPSYNQGYAAGEVTGDTIATQTDPNAVSSWCASQQLMIGVPGDVTNGGDWNIGWYAGCQAGALGQ
jgi:hypothetical protein